MRFTVPDDRRVSGGSGYTPVYSTLGDPVAVSLGARLGPILIRMSTKEGDQQAHESSEVGGCYPPLVRLLTAVTGGVLV